MSDILPFFPPRYHNAPRRTKCCVCGMNLAPVRSPAEQVCTDAGPCMYRAAILSRHQFPYHRLALNAHWRLTLKYLKEPA